MTIVHDKLRGLMGDGPPSLAWEEHIRTKVPTEVINSARAEYASKIKCTNVLYGIVKKF